MFLTVKNPFATPFLAYQSIFYLIIVQIKFYNSTHLTMKTFTLITLLFTSFYMQAQYDFSHFQDSTSTSLDARIDAGGASGIYFSGDIEPSGSLNDLEADDTLYFPYTISSLTPTSGDLNSTDTLTLDIAAVAWLNSLDASYTVSYYGGSFSYDNITGINANNFDTYKLVEGKTDTIKIVVHSGLLSFDRFNVRSASSEVILNTTAGLLSQNVRLTNPVEDRQLRIDLLGEEADLNLLNLEGEVLKTFHVEGAMTLPVADLSSGIYLLRETSGGIARKIMIK